MFPSPRSQLCGGPSWFLECQLISHHQGYFLGHYRLFLSKVQTDQSCRAEGRRTDPSRMSGSDLRQRHPAPRGPNQLGKLNHSTPQLCPTFRAE